MQQHKNRTDRGLRPAQLSLLACMLSAGLLLGCEDDEDNDGTSGGPDFVTQVVIEDGAGEARETLDRGEDVTVVAEVRNRSDREQTLEFRDGRTSDFVVLDAAGNEARLWSEGRSFTQALEEKSFDAGQTRRFEMDWEGLEDGDGEPLPTGDYEIQAWLPADGARDGTDDLSPGPLRSTLKPFRIE